MHLVQGVFMKKLSLLPNFITAFGLACGLFVIFKVNMIEPGGCYFQVVKTSAIFLLLAAVADFIDGAVARVFKAESEFGFIFDSLADAVSFGVAPSVLMLKSLSLEQGTLFSFLSATGAMVFSLCGILRLVRFSVKTKQASGDIVEMSAMKKHFTGLPIPAGAAAAVSVNLFFLSPVAQIFPLSEEARVIILSSSMIFLGYLMVSRWKFPSLKALNFRVRSFQLAFLAVVIASVILYGILYYFSLIFFIASWGYVIVALIFAIIRVIAGKKSKTLQDFEPEPEDEDFDLAEEFNKEDH
jgi:CDP-diacylglycerol---serine O-phosphatidyltransferase